MDLWFQAAQLQSERSRDPSANSKVGRIDINFYVVAVKRLREAVVHAVRRLDLNELRSDVEAFDERWPGFAELRNRQEHYRDPVGGYPSETWYFTGSVVDLKPGGKVEYLVDTDSMTPWIERLYEAGATALDAEIEKLESRAA